MNATHERTVTLIKQSGSTLAMKVVTVKTVNSDGHNVHMDGTRTLPMKKKGLHQFIPFFSNTSQLYHFFVFLGIDSY